MKAPTSRADGLEPNAATERRQRRALMAGLLAGSAAWLTRGAAAQPAQAAALTPTPAQTEGPFYPVRLPAEHDGDLLRNGALDYAAGQPVRLDGRVVASDGRPLAGGEIEIWQCDAEGHYHHPGDGDRADPAFQGFGRVRLDADGCYRFRAMRPAAYSGRTPHIHVKVRHKGRELLTTQLYVEGDPGNARDGIWRRLPTAARSAVTVPFQSTAEGLCAWFPIVVRA